MNRMIRFLGLSLLAACASGAIAARSHNWLTFALAVCLFILALMMESKASEWTREQGIKYAIAFLWERFPQETGNIASKIIQKKEDKA